MLSFYKIISYLIKDFYVIWHAGLPLKTAYSQASRNFA